jgi:hypothetical protein
VLALDRPEGSVLVLDCSGNRLSDARVVGRIASDEPPQNASLLAVMYASDEARGRPRALCAADLAAFAAAPPSEGSERSPSAGLLLDAEGNDYAIRATPTEGPAALRWTCTPPGALAAVPVSLRSAVGALERYEPPIFLTEAALADAGGEVSVRTLRGELERLRRSSILLNRGIREAVAQRAAEGVTLSEIALRCGRVKHDRRGGLSGETSWLARRIGQMPEGGEARPTPWIHSDTLALIAREGLCISPREVEL